MDFGKSIQRSMDRAAAKKKASAAAAAKSKAAAEAKAAETARRTETLANADTSTVSGRIQKQAGMEGFDDPRNQDIIKGAQFGEAVLGDGLGRLGQSDTLDAMTAQSAELAKGFSSEEMQARKEKGLEEIQGSTSAQMRATQAALARSGVKGQAGGAQLANVAMSGVQARGNLERDLMIANREAQMQGLQAQSGIFSQAQSRQEFDIGQAAKEKDIALQAGLGFAQMGATERAAELNRQAQVKAARAGRQRSCFIEGTKIQMEDGTLKNIEDIKITDKLKDGGVVYALNQGITDGAYMFGDTIVTGGHAVLDADGVWKRVKDANAIVYLSGVNYVYNLSCENHIIRTEDGTTFSDFDETDLGSTISDQESLEVLNGKGNKVLAGGRGL